MKWGVIEMLNSKKYSTIKTVLTILKIPEIVSTLVIIIGIVGVIFWSWSYYTPVGAVVARVILFIIRLALINEKHKCEGLVKK
jgi:hypothetical protein